MPQILPHDAQSLLREDVVAPRAEGKFRVHAVEDVDLAFAASGKKQAGNRAQAD